MASGMFEIESNPSLNTIRKKMNLAFQGLLNVKHAIFNKMREMDCKQYAPGSADIYDNELERVKEEYDKNKAEVWKHFTKSETEKEFMQMDREFQYQFLETKQKILEIRNSEENKVIPTWRSCFNAAPMGCMSLSSNNPYFFKCNDCYTDMQKVNVTFKCELCSKHLGSIVFN